MLPEGYHHKPQISSNQSLYLYRSQFNSCECRYWSTSISQPLSVKGLSVTRRSKRLKANLQPSESNQIHCWFGFVLLPSIGIFLMPTSKDETRFQIGDAFLSSKSKHRNSKKACSIDTVAICWSRFWRDMLKCLGILWAQFESISGSVQYVSSFAEGPRVAAWPCTQRRSPWTELRTHGTVAQFNCQPQQHPRPQQPQPHRQHPRVALKWLAIRSNFIVHGA